MNFDEFNNYVQERWEGVLELIEANKNVQDYALGRFMIKIANSKNPIIKGMNKRVYKKASKTVHSKIQNYKIGLQLMAEEVAGIILQKVPKENIVQGEITASNKNTVIDVVAKIKPCDTEGLKENIESYLDRCVKAKKLGSYTCNISKTSIKVTVRL